MSCGTLVALQKSHPNHRARRTQPQEGESKSLTYGLGILLVTTRRVQLRLRSVHLFHDFVVLLLQFPHPFSTHYTHLQLLLAIPLVRKQAHPWL